MSLLVKIPEKPKTTKISFEVPEELNQRLTEATKEAKRLGFAIDLDEALKGAFGRIVNKLEKEVAAEAGKQRDGRT